MYSQSRLCFNPRAVISIFAEARIEFEYFYEFLLGKSTISKINHSSFDNIYNILQIRPIFISYVHLVGKCIGTAQNSNCQLSIKIQEILIKMCLKSGFSVPVPEIKMRIPNPDLGIALSRRYSPAQRCCCLAFQYYVLILEHMCASKMSQAK